MATTITELSFDDMRKIVIALDQTGRLMKGGTFSLGNLGNEYQALALRIDQHVTDLNEPDELVIRKTSDVENDVVFGRNYNAQREQVVADLQKFIGELAAELGCEPYCNGVLAAVRQLRAKTAKKKKIKWLTPIPKDGYVSSIADFQEECKSGMFVDSDGTGYFGNTIVYDRRAQAVPSKIKAGEIPGGDFTHVVWFNK